MAVDLHTHTTFSDGTLSPQELVEKAVAYKLTAIAITDHDEIAANDLANVHAKNLPLDVVPGAEFSIDIELQGKAHLHLLGLFLNTRNSRLIDVLNDLRAARKKRAIEIIRKLNAHGMNLKLEELEAISGKGSAGRPHIARMLIKNQVVGSVWEAFNKYLSKGQVGYVAKKKLNLRFAIDLIHESHGLAVLAHPVSLKHKTYKETEAFLRELKYIGLDGVEAYYAGHTRNFTTYLINAANRNNLLLSGGSDYHGLNKPDTDLGRGRGNLNVPDKVYFDLKNALVI